MSAVLLDTCASIFLMEQAPMRPAALDAIHAAIVDYQLLVPAITAWEVGLIARPGRANSYVFVPTAEDWYARLLSFRGVREAPLTASAMLASAKLPLLLKDPADRFIIATAQELGVPIVTRDAMFREYAKLGGAPVIAC